MIKVGVVGYQRSAIQYHIPCIQGLEKAIVSYIVDPSKKRLQQARADVKCKGYLTDYHELLDKKDVDLISISTHSTLNPQMCLEVAKSGKDFIVESPFAFTVDEAKEIRDAAKKHGAKACLAQSYRFTPAIYPIVKKHQLGELGRIFSVHVVAFEASPRLNPRIDPFVVHTAAADALSLFGGLASKVYAKTLSFFNDRDGCLEPEIRALIEFENLCTGYLDWSGYAPVTNFTIDVYGTGALVKLDLKTSTTEVLNWWWNPGHRLRAFKKIISGLKDFFKRYRHLYQSGYLLMWEEFLNSIEDDSPSPVPLDDGVRFVALIEAIKKSITNQFDVSL